MKYFLYDKRMNELSINDEHILLVKEFKNIIDIKRNKCKEDKTGKKLLRAFKEFKYMYLFFDWSSPYFQYSEAEKHQESLLDSELTSEELTDEVFKEACKKYDNMQNSSKIAKLLKASYHTVDKITHYLDNLDLEERDPVTGKPIFKTKDVIMEMSSASKLIDAIKTMEISFKKELEPESGLRGDKIPGLFD